jgi:hypothetical protein
MILVVTDDSCSLAVSPIKKLKRATKVPAANSESDDEKLDDKSADPSKGIQNTPQVVSKKISNVLQARRGYDSESEATKSVVSTSASSTIPVLRRKQTKESNEITPKVVRKAHARSLSQIPKSRTDKKDDDSVSEMGEVVNYKFLDEEKT